MTKSTIASARAGVPSPSNDHPGESSLANSPIRPSYWRSISKRLASSTTRSSASQSSWSEKVRSSSAAAAIPVYRSRRARLEPPTARPRWRGPSRTSRRRSRRCGRNEVKIEDYDLPGLKTQHGIADVGFGRMAWIIDPGANCLGIVQERVPGKLHGENVSRR